MRNFTNSNYRKMTKKNIEIFLSSTPMCIKC